MRYDNSSRGRALSLAALCALAALAAGCPSQPSSVFLDPLVPPAARSAILESLGRDLPGLAYSKEERGADAVIFMEPTGGTLEGRAALGRWDFALVAPFSSQAEGLSSAGLEAYLRGGNLPAPMDAATVFVDADDASLAGLLFAEPSSARMQAAPAGELAKACWGKKGSLAIVGFEGLEPHWKPLNVSGVNILDRDASMEAYPLSLRVAARGEAGLVAKIAASLGGKVVNRDPARLATVTMTGVTALTRVTGRRMDQRGVTYPGLYIADLLKAADITHTSNEVSFSPDCVITTTKDTMAFCSKPEYLDLLEFVGVDVVELTGNHLLDFGSAPFLNSLAMYGARGMAYFGGGKDLQDAAKPLEMESNGNRFAFIGACAGYSPSFASPGKPGPRQYDQAALEKDIRAARAAGKIPIVSIQYTEDYEYAPTAAQRACFRSLVDAGAAIVQGSQAHQPQSFEFYKGGFIHYGLGNLFFDQMWSLGTRESLIDTHYFYGNRHIATAVAAALIEDFSQPRPLSGAAREDVLAKVYKASLWFGKAF